MPPKKSIGVFFITSLLTTVLSASVMFVAPLPARFLRLTYGRLVYWCFTLLSSTMLAPLSLPWALSHFTLLLLIGLFTDLEEMKVPLFYAAVSAIFISGLSFSILLIVWAKSQGQGISNILKSKITEVITLSQKMQQMEFPVDPQQVLAMFPAIIAIALMMLIFVSVVFVKTAGRKEQLTTFKVPEPVIWPFIICLAGAFLVDEKAYFWWHNTFINGLYFTSALYYFQGLAIMGFFIKRTKVNYFLKAAVFVVLTVYLFIFVAAFGLSDVWFGYRSKAYRKVLKNKL